MLKPKHCHFNPNKETTTIYFDDKEGAYRMRGGLCFPAMIQISGQKDIQGFAIMAGQDIKTGKVYIYEQKDFLVVDDIIGDDGVEFYGIGKWFNKCWSRYYGSKYFFKQHFEIAKKYRLDIIRSPMVAPKPHLIEVDWPDDKEAYSVIWKYVKLGKLVYDADSPLDKALFQIKNDEKDFNPIVHALTTLLWGIERFPYRERKGENQ